MPQPPLTRRDLLLAGAAAAVVLPQVAQGAETVHTRAQRDPWHGLKIGVASYTLRKAAVDDTTKGIRRVGLAYVSIKDAHLPLQSTAEQRRQVGRRFRDAGITPLSCGVIYMQNNEASVRHAFEYARDLGVPTIVCSPDPGSFPILDRMVKEFDLRLAIHNHGPGDRNFPSPYDVMAAAEKYDPRIGLCIDVGHTARAGVDPAEAIRKCRDRLYDVHLKDIDRLAANGAPVEGGRGILDMKSILMALAQSGYAHHAGFEYEKDADDPLPGLAETVGYCRGLLAS